MMWLDALAAGLTFFYLPIPVFWLLLHPFAAFWKGRHRAALWTSMGIAWGLAGALLWMFGERLFAAAQAPWWAVAAGFALIALDGVVLHRVHRELGSARLVGHAELTGTGELNTAGLYARVRHPRYTAMMAGMLGICVMAGTLLLWLVTAVWWLLVLLAVWFEERELAARFGEKYLRYRAGVPAFLPFRFWPRED